MKKQQIKAKKIWPPRSATVFTGKKSGRSFEIREVAGSHVDAKVTRAVMQMLRNRNKYIKYLDKTISAFLNAMAPINRVELSERMAMSQVRTALRFARTHYLNRGKPIPGHPGDMEYQGKAVAAILTLTELAQHEPVNNTVTTTKHPIPRQARHGNKQRR